MTNEEIEKKFEEELKNGNKIEIHCKVDNGKLQHFICVCDNVGLEIFLANLFANVARNSGGLNPIVKSILNALKTALTHYVIDKEGIEKVKDLDNLKYKDKERLLEKTAEVESEVFKQIIEEMTFNPLTKKTIDNLIIKLGFEDENNESQIQINEGGLH